MSKLRRVKATLDLNRKSWNIERIEAIQGDIDSLTLEVQIVDSGKIPDLSEYVPTFAVVLPGTTEYVIDNLHFDTSKMNEGYFEYTFVKEAFSVAGTYDTARFILQKADKTELSGMPRFTYFVEADPLQGKVVAESYVSDFERLEQMIHAVELEIAELHDEVTSESVRLDSEIAELDEKINTETSKLQSEADELQQQFDNLNPAQFAQKTALDEHVNDADIHVTATDKTNWNAKETTEGSQAKADKALSDAKTDAATLYEPKISVTAWVAPALKTGFSILSSAYPPLYRLKGSTLQLKGAIGRTSAKGVMFTLPAGYRPAERRGFSTPLVSSVSGTVATVYIQPSGDVELVAASQDSPVWIEISLDID
ncbi:BppU family phage baseplate upper protein [Listeria sp. FSL L7-0083]|uniref:BppU family phage baseplate upper protein n=1 Tax=Listeria farberi TaxID=2713500 RepID=UPI0016283FED|nr:BppU family phage baseplate upper protein [Listeria farberi]MBC2267657.1 BppU family phage baseplate upper protein [Listeria farberi]